VGKQVCHHGNLQMKGTLMWYKKECTLANRRLSVHKEGTKEMIRLERAKPEMTLDLDKITNRHEQIFGDPKDARYFKIQIGTKEHQFYTDNPKESRQWVDLLRMACALGPAEAFTSNILLPIAAIVGVYLLYTVLPYVQVATGLIVGVLLTCSGIANRRRDRCMVGIPMILCSCVALFVMMG